MAVFIKWPSGITGCYARGSQCPIWCDRPGDWKDLIHRLVDQQVTQEMIDRARVAKPPPKPKQAKTSRRRKENRMVLKGDDTTITAKGTTYE